MRLLTLRGVMALAEVVRQLPLAPALGLVDRLLHRIGDLVGVEDGLAVQVARRPADRLDQAAARAQEAFLVGVEDGDQRHLGNVEPLTQQVDADQHVEGAQAQVADDLDALDGVDVAVEVTHFHAVVVQVIGELLGHPLGQRGDQHALADVDPVANLLQDVVDLACGRANFELRVDQAGGPHELLDDLPGMALS